MVIVLPNSNSHFKAKRTSEQTKTVNKYHIINKNLTDFWVDKSANIHTHTHRERKVNDCERGEGDEGVWGSNK